MPANTIALATSKPGPDIARPAWAMALARPGPGAGALHGQGQGQSLSGLWLLALVMGFGRGCCCYFCYCCCRRRIVLDALSYVEHFYPRLGDALPRRHIVSFF